MKILSIEQVRTADAYTIENEPIASIDLMERAANVFFKWLKKRLRKKDRLVIFCGTGNNGGDGLVVARLLSQHGYEVEVNIVRFSERSSEDFDINLKRLDDVDLEVNEIREDDQIPLINDASILIDAIFGSGLSKPVKGLAAEVIGRINKSRSVVISVDTPSGLFSDAASSEKEGAIIKADYTISFQFPKLAFMFPENEVFVGEWFVKSIGLHDQFIDSVSVKNFYIKKDNCSGIYKHRTKFSHKGNYGHALIIAGSYGKMGASVLAAKACLKSGVGLLHTHIPVQGYQIMQTAVPEAMVSIDEHDSYFSGLPDLMMYNAIAVGPGIGLEEQTRNSLKLLIQESNIPMVFDADALTILGENKTWLSFLPKLSILTPHPKEFERLVGPSSNNFERHKLQLEFSIKYGVYVVDVNGKV